MIVDFIRTQNAVPCIPMPQVRFSKRALLDLKKLREFLQPKIRIAARRAAETVIRSNYVLIQHPRISRPIPHMPDGTYELQISHGNSGYVARCRYKRAEVTMSSVSDQNG